MYLRSTNTGTYAAIFNSDLTASQHLAKHFAGLPSRLCVTLSPLFFQLIAFMTSPSPISDTDLNLLAQRLEGDLFYDNTMRTLYATDASAYREMPLAVAIPKSIGDLKALISYAAE